MPTPDDFYDDAEREARQALALLYEAAADAVAALGSYDEALAEAAVVDALSDDVQEQPLLDLLATLHTPVAEAVGTSTHADLGGVRAARALPVWADIVSAFLRLHGGALVKTMAGRSRAQVIAALRLVAPPLAADGAGLPTIARALRDEVSGMARRRATTIARTEVIRASNYASLAGAAQAAEDTSLALVKIWVATGGGRTRESHAAADGQRQPLDEPFVVGGEQAQYPGDPSLSAAESVNCRCTVAYEPA